MVLLKNRNRQAEEVLIKELNAYLNIIHEIYSKLEWEVEYWFLYIHSFKKYYHKKDHFSIKVGQYKSNIFPLEM